ncbi:hypothetical protein I204_08492 [Kwoniella mangroviensis CBS 8886]|uniref:uncharacterized protein n=1 Tax=Kwoniella mangroviensis CBS 8507 TaxID=1296122 RepID=UPI00080D567D|nr:uncharacterized protein I203_01501 [Kwoniella mangroviensis CBS 8507]OCF69637.1 hypothetical protein I203_01501 [Kwoniella mangroviensis CBS 8507]OCF70862.1 hypothetical protein I204_08492 [Kwoniella mangroviensis CBS 8886]
MFSLTLTTLLPLVPLLASVSAQYTATYQVGSLPQYSEEGQSGTNQCGTTSSQTSNCQNVFVNAVDDFCLWGPPDTHSEEGDGTSKIGNVEQIVVAYCLKDGYGTRLIPEGTIKGAHFVKVESEKVSYVQVTGNGDLTKLLIPAGDEGGELDPHSWTGLGNPQGGLVFTNAFSGSYEQTHEWTSFMSSDEFCIRACRDGPNAAAYCEHIYDVLSCGFTIPGDMGDGFDQCLGAPTDEAPGVYDGVKFHQDDPTTPAPHPAGATSQCTPYSTIGGGTANVAAVTQLASVQSSSTSASASASASNSSSSASSTSASGSGSSSAPVSATITSSAVSSRAAASTNAAAASAAASASASASSVNSGAGRLVIPSLGLAMVLGAIGMCL